MRATIVVGVLLVLAGGFVLLRGVSFTKDKTVLDMGPIQASVTEKQMVPPWVGGIAVAAGIALIATGGLKSRS
jgi:hypothetical protein